jgi:hypothetical protein
MELGRGVLCAGLAVAAVAAGGCGYSTERPFPRHDADGRPIRTIAVEIFQSREFRRGLELQLTEALAKRIEAETPYRLAGKARADTVLRGEVKEVRQSTIGHDFAQNRPRETAATFVVAMQWKDLRTGRVLVDRPNLVQTVDYIRPLKENLRGQPAGIGKVGRADGRANGGGVVGAAGL